MELRKVSALRGPNVWGRSPALEAWVDLGAWGVASPETFREFEGRLADAFGADPAGLGRPAGGGGGDGPAARIVDALGGVARELQRRAGVAGEPSRTRPTREAGVYRVAFGYEEETLARACLDAAREVCLAALDGRRVDAEGTSRRLSELAHAVRLGPSTLAIVEAARARGIPARRLNTGSLVRLGQGSRQRRVLAAETDRTGAIAEWIASDKDLTRTLLREAGVPVPAGRPAVDADDAWAAAEEVGLPVVVKPRYGNQGRGVATNLSTREQVQSAFEAASDEGDSVVVERHAPGGDYRLLVVNGRVVAAARREPARVVGDGRRTVAGLVEAVNRDPRRAEGHATALSPIPLDAVSLGVLAEQGYTPDAVPPAGAVVLVRRNANLSTGGTAEDVTDLVHPEVAARAAEAARVVGIDVTGVDVVAEAIDRPLEGQGGVIVEVNAAPGLRMHLEPSSGRSRPVGEAIVASIFPDGEDGRIPVAGVTGVNGKTTVTRALAHVLRGTGLRVGMTCTDGVYLGERRIEAGDCSGPASARAVLANPDVDAAVLETARGGILRAGMGFDGCRVAVVTNVGEGDHLGMADVETPEDLARVKGALVTALLPGGTAVLNAADPLVAPMAARSPGPVIFFARDEAHPVVAGHRERGGRAVFERDGVLVRAEGASATVLMPLALAPMTHGGRVGFQVENALAVAAAAWALGVTDDLIRAGLGSFRADGGQAPGRFNVLKAGGRTVVVDYGHNPSAVAALVAAIDGFPHPRRTVAFTAAGDRRDADIVRQGELLGAAFDRVILYEDQSTRGRPAGEIVGLLRRGLSAGRRAREVAVAATEAEAIAAAVEGAAPGELVVIQADESGEVTLELVRRVLEP